MKLLFKAHIKAYQRTSQSGQTVMVKEHDDKRLAARPKSKHPRRRAFATPAHPAAPHHELTREEFHAHARKQPGGLDRSPASIDQEHKRHIRQALKDGKQVPAFVTSDYAEFRSDKQQPQAKQPPQPGEKPPSNDDQTWFNEEDDDMYDFEKPVDKSQVHESSETNANDEFSWFNDDEDEGQAPLQEQGQRDNPDASRPGLQKAALNRRTFRSDGRKPERSDSPSLQATLRKASRLHANLTKALVYLDDDLTSPDLDPTSRGVLRAERYRLLSQLEALQQKMDEVTHA